jgi:hypothetical protein
MALLYFEIPQFRVVHDNTLAERRQRGFCGVILDQNASVLSGI